MITLEIVKNSCIKCTKCVRVCPSYIFSQGEPKAEIELHNIDKCIVCGHCVDVCPTDSIVHSSFPSDKIHSLNRDMLPSPDQMLELCRARRSNRAFSKKPIPEEYLRQIIEAAHLAPTAGNRQGVNFTLITNKDLIEQINKLTIDIYTETIKKLTNPLLKPLINLMSPSAKNALPKLKGVVNAHQKGADIIMRGAKVLLFIHTDSKSIFGRQDANLAYQNGSLMAESLGVSQFYTGFVCSAIDMDKRKRLTKLLNIKGQTIHAGMALGMPLFKFPKYADKEELCLNWVK